MQFFLQRLQEGELDGARDSFLLVQVIKEYPEAYRCALLIRDYVKAQLDITLGGNELLWLTVHLVRIAGLDA
jgi:beta-glucoside operon transcriptional antiterminator